jgi:hypothetical protein
MAVFSGTTAGGQSLTVSGSGFLPDETEVTVCDLDCPVVPSSVTSSQLICITPENAGKLPVIVIMVQKLLELGWV